LLGGTEKNHENLREIDVNTEIYIWSIPEMNHSDRPGPIPHFKTLNHSKVIKIYITE
jgi:hypothetical protein